jgi:hypothetical protein
MLAQFMSRIHLLEEKIEIMLIDKKIPIYFNFSKYRDFIFVNAYFLVLIAFYWRNISFAPGNYLPGDAADSRYSTSLYEHWYLFFQGYLGLTENFFFFPENNSMAFSDAYLFQGLIHALLRILGFDILTSWLLASFLIHAIGSYSAVLISRTLKLSIFPSIVLITYWGFNSVMWVKRGHLQSLAYPLVGFTIFFMIKFFQTQNRFKRNLYLGISLNSACVTALSSSYTIVFLVLFSLVGLIVYQLYEGKLRFGFKFIKEQLSRTWNFFILYIFGVLSSVPMIFLFLYIYVISPTHLTTRSPSEAVYFSPTFSELFEVPPQNYFFGKVTNYFFSRALPGIGERYNGFTISFILLMVIASISLIKDIKSLRKIETSEKILLCLISTMIFLEILVIRDARGFNLWYFTGAQLPFFDAIRGISRIHQFQYMFGGIFIAVMIQKGMILKVLKFFGKIKLFRFKFTKFILLIALVFNPLLEASSYYGTWHSSQFNPINLNHEDFNGCESFAVLLSDEQLNSKPWYEYKIDAQILATQIRIPTITGYSGGKPLNYDLDYSSEVNLEKSMLKYIALKNLKYVCFVKFNANNSQWNLYRKVQ